MITDAEYIRRALDSLKPNVPPAEWEAYKTVALLRVQGYKLWEIAMIEDVSIRSVSNKLKNLKK